MRDSAGRVNKWRAPVSEWLAMGGHAAYVWSSFALTAGVVAWNVLAARLQLSRARQEVMEILDEDDGA